MQRNLGHGDTRQNPDDLRFTKRIIDLNFPGQLDFENIYDVLYALETGKLNTRDLPSLRVISHGGQLWTLDNKLLYIYRISPKVRRISVVQVSGKRFLDKFLHENSAVMIEGMASGEFFPEVNNRGKRPKPKPSFQSACGQTSIEKHLAKAKCGTKRSLAPKSSSSVKSISSSRTVTSRISSENTETGTSSSISIESKYVKLDSQPSTTSPTNLTKLSSEDHVDPETCYPAVRSMTGEQLHLEYKSVRISEQEENESTSTSLRLSNFTSIDVNRPSTCQLSSRFSFSHFPGAIEATTTQNNSEAAFARREVRAKTAPPGRVSPDRYRENFFRRFTSRCRQNSLEVAHGTTSTKFLTNFRDNNSFQTSSTKFYDSHETLNCSSKLEIGEDELVNEFNLEAFVLPDLWHPLPSEVQESATNESIREETIPSHVEQTSTSPHQLDRSVSSCSSSTERPMITHARRGSEGVKHETPFVRKTSTTRASVSAGRALTCNVAAENEFQVPKQLLLKHMKKAFFSVC